MPTKNDIPSFATKVWIAGGILAFITVLLLIFHAAHQVLLLLLAAILLAVFFAGLAGLIQRKTGWKPGLTKVLSVLLTLLILVGLFWLIGAKVQQQATQLSETLPSTIEKARQYLEQSSMGKKIIQKLESPETQKQAQSMATSFFRSGFGVFGDLYAILFMGLFFFAAPTLYRDGMVKLVPPNGKKQAGSLLDTLGNNLKQWMKGTLFSMATVFTLTAIGLLIMGVDMWLVLALLAGLLSFIPNIGPLIALIPAALVGLLDSPTTALLIIGLYLLVQAVESNLITPMVQQKLVNTPPALILLMQLFMAALTGGWGLVLATPLLVIIMVVVKELHVKRMEEGEG